MQDFDILDRTKAYYAAGPHKKPMVKTKIMKPIHLQRLTVAEAIKFPLAALLVGLYVYPHSGRYLRLAAEKDKSRVENKGIPSITG